MDEQVGTVWVGEVIKAHHTSAGEPEGNILGRPSNRWEDNIIRHYGVKMCNGLIWFRTEPSDLGPRF
jgi:hypothetical protein